MKNKNVCGKWIAVGGAAVAVVLIGINVQSALAYPKWDQGCQTCHGDFLDDTSPQGTVFPGGSKHDMHRFGTMNTGCTLCHVNVGDNPFLKESGSDGYGGGPGPGCTGCHGRDYGAPSGNSAVGLRAHHVTNGISCSPCHDGDPNPLPENILPFFYGSSNTNASDSCNPGGNGENFSDDTDNTNGLDNDGDNLYDENDPDCQDAPCPWDCQNTPDGEVNIPDFLAILAQWGQVGSPCDFDGGGVSVTDFLEFLANFGPCP